MASRPGNVRTGARLRLVLEPDVALGPGKADLLQEIDLKGSIAAAGRVLGMSYKRAWLLIEALNQDFGADVVDTMKGGSSRGGATLTPLGRSILTLYRQMEEKAAVAVENDLDELKALRRNR